MKSIKKKHLCISISEENEYKLKRLANYYGMNVSQYLSYRITLEYSQMIIMEMEEKKQTAQEQSES